MKLERANSSRLAWRIVIVALVLLAILPPVVIGILMYQAADQRATIERIKRLGGDVTVEEADPPDEEASLGENLLALCRIDEVAYVEVATPYAGDLDELVRAIADLRSANSLELRGVNLNDEHLRQLSRLPAVESLDLQATDITDAGLEHLARFTHLKWLDLQYSTISDEAIDAIGRAKTLETVIVRNSQVTEAGAQRLRQLLPDADIFSSPVPSDGHCRVLRDLMKRGVHVHVRGGNLRDADGIRVHSNQSQTWAGFDWNKLREIDGLKEASLAYIDAPDVAMAALARCPQLQVLSLAGMQLDQVTLSRIGDCNSLRDLTIAECKLGAGTLLKLSRFPHLERLRIKQATIDREVIQRILSLDRLHYLHLWECEIDNSALAQVAPPHSLENLCLWKSNFNDEGLVGVMRWPSLTSLDASWTKVTGATLDQVEIPSPNLVSIELLETEWTDQGMQNLSRWKNLQELRIVGTKVTDASIEAISSLPHLKKMSLPDALMTAEAVRKWDAAATSDAKSAGDSAR